MSKSVERVQTALENLGFTGEIRFMDKDTHTAQQAAETLGCDVAQIVKSLVFRTADNRPVLAITSGANRVDLKRLGAIVGSEIGKADAQFVRDTTGFAIGGVAPVGIPEDVITLFDQDLFSHDTVWAAAGAPNTLFPIKQQDFRKLAAGRIFDFVERS